MDILRGLVASSIDNKTFQNYLNSLGCTHLLVRMDLYLKYLHDNYSLEKANRLFQQMSRATETIYNANGYAVYRLIPQR